MPPIVAVLPSTTPSPQTQRKTWFEPPPPAIVQAARNEAGDQAGRNDCRDLKRGRFRGFFGGLRLY